MKLSLLIARRYLFAKKSTNAINIITGISVFGVCVGAAALVLILSVFNGFEDLITQMYSSFNPDVKVTLARGKTFETDSALLQRLEDLEGVEAVSQTLQEVAFFEYSINQDFGTLKGVDDNWRIVTPIDSSVQEGQYLLQLEGRELAVLGLGMRNKLGVNVEDPLKPLVVYMPKRREVGVFEEPFRRRLAYPAGTFIIQQEFDNQYILTSLDFARDLLALPNQVSALEIKLSPGTEAYQKWTVQQIRDLMGPDFEVKNRFEQEETFLRLMQMEKWLSYALVNLMMLLVAFNMVGALWMIVLEKKQDIAILKSMGATDASVRNIFLAEGFLLTLFGIVIGFVLALLIYWIQVTVGIVRIPGNFVVEAYPISIRLIDFITVFITVSAVGLLASLPPALRAQRVPAFLREE